MTQYSNRIATHRLRVWVEAYGTHTEAADKLRLTLPTLRAYLYGHRIPSSRAAFALEKATKRKVRMLDWHKEVKE